MFTLAETDKNAYVELCGDVHTAHKQRPMGSVHTFNGIGFGAGVGVGVGQCE